MATKQHDPAKWARIEEQSEKIADLIGVDAEDIMIDPHYGVLLTTSQTDKLLALVQQSTAAEECKCRCNEGRHCGGCGHEGCGYTVVVAS